MFLIINSFTIYLIASVGIVFILALLIITPVRKSYLKWKWIAISLMTLALLLKLLDKLI